MADNYGDGLTDIIALSQTVDISLIETIVPVLVVVVAVVFVKDLKQHYLNLDRRAPK